MNALVTGASAGIGKEMVFLLAQRGYHVVMVARRQERLEELLDDLPFGGTAIAQDLALPGAARQLWEVCREKELAIDVLVNNAGTVALGMIGQFDMVKWQKVIDVNLTGTFLGMQASVEAMKAAGGGSIINISSIEGLRGAVMVHPYVASKWAVRGLTKSAALELGQFNIRVNSVHPGFIRTPMTKHFPDNVLRIPLGRPGQPDEVATFVVFLASDESSFMTATDLLIDGGYTAV